MGNVTTVGVDLAKNLFAVHGVDGSGQVVMRRTVRRERLVELIAQLPRCLIGMEACSGAHEWARRFAQFGHTVRLMAPKFVAPYRKSGKNDDNDAAAICEAVGRPNMRFVPVKTLEQHAVLTQHRIRQGFIEERTATLNRIRGVLAEFGQVLPQSASAVRRGLSACFEHLPQRVARGLEDLLAHVGRLDERISAYDRELALHARTAPDAQRIRQLSGIGPVTASAIVASVGTAAEFRNGRQFAAWLGLTPRQYSSGGKTRLGHITRRGDPYLRTLLIMGARAVLQAATRRQDRLSRWALSVRARRGYHRACVAIAAKNARILWAARTRGDLASRLRQARSHRHTAQQATTQQVRPALAEPDQRVGHKGRLTIEERARGLHPGSGITSPINKAD